METTFPILRLPFLALKEVLKCFTPFELLDLAECSKKCSRIVKIVGVLIIRMSLHPQNLFIKINNNFYIEVFDEKKKKNVTAVRKFGDLTLAMTADYVLRYVSVFCDDRMLGISEVFKSFLNTLTCRVDQMYTDHYVPREKFLSCVKALPKLCCKNFDVEADYLSDEDATWILDNVTVTDFYRLCQKLFDSFSYDGKPFEAQRVWIFWSTWLTVDHFDKLMKNCAMVTLDESIWTNEDIRKLISKWRAGKYPKLKNLTVQSSNFDDGLKIEGVDALENKHNPVFYSRPFLNSRMMIFNSVPIEHDDGSVGQIYYNKTNRKVHLYI